MYLLLPPFVTVTRTPEENEKEGEMGEERGDGRRGGEEEIARLAEPRPRGA